MNQSPFADPNRHDLRPPLDHMRRVVLESPCAGATAETMFENELYAHKALRDCLLRGEAPIASHVLLAFSGVLDDDHPAERAQGINAGHAWMRGCDAVVVYTDRGISEGMKAGITVAGMFGKPVEYRTISTEDAA